MHGHMKPPEQTRRDGLTLLGSDVDFAPVDGPAAHPLLCKGKQQTGDLVKSHAADLSRWTGELYSVSDGTVNNQSDVFKHQRDQQPC